MAGPRYSSEDGRLAGERTFVAVSVWISLLTVADSLGSRLLTLNAGAAGRRMRSCGSSRRAIRLRGRDPRQRGVTGFPTRFCLPGARRIFELQFQLLDQPRRALGALPVQFTFQLLDTQLEMRDPRLGVGRMACALAASACQLDLECDAVVRPDAVGEIVGELEDSERPVRVSIWN